MRPLIFLLAAVAASVGLFGQGNGKQNITIDVSGPANVTDNPIVGIGTFTKRGNGTLTLRRDLTADLIDLQRGTLLLGADNLIGDSTNMRLSGGNFSTGGHDERLGSLTLAANSVIDFDGGSSILHFDSSSSAQWSDSTLVLVNWTGGSDHIFFDDAVTGLSASQVAKIRFQTSDGSLLGATILCNGEVVPVPEPATIGFGALLLGSVALRERKRVFALWGKLAGH